MRFDEKDLQALRGRDGENPPRRRPERDPNGETRAVALACPGPSLHPDDIPVDLPVAAINAALKGIPRCDYWICYDTPNHIHECAREAFLELRPTIVTNLERAKGWFKWLKDLKVSRGEWPSIEIADEGPHWLKTAIKSGPRYSSTMAVSWAVRRRFSHVYFVGCDLGGFGYHDKVATSKIRGMKEGIEARWNKRWQAERKLMRSCRDVCLERGIRLENLPDNL